METTTFGAWLRAERKRRGKTIYDIGALAEVSHVAVSDWERGKRNPRRESVELVAAALAEPNSRPEDAARLLSEALKAAGFSSLDPELETEPNEEFLQERLMAYTGDNPILVGAASTARGIAEALERAKANGPVGGEGMPPIVGRGRGPVKKKIQKVDE